jgi:hypothetical protein
MVFATVDTFYIQILIHYHNFYLSEDHEKAVSLETVGQHLGRDVLR